jgi:hypothetical protein
LWIEPPHRLYRTVAVIGARPHNDRRNQLSLPIADHQIPANSG